MEQTLTALREELETEVQALTKSRSIEDRAALMAKEAEVSKVCATESVDNQILTSWQVVRRHAAHLPGNLYLDGEMVTERVTSNIDGSHVSTSDSLRNAATSLG